MPAGARTHRPMNTPKPMSFTITTDRATTPRAHTLLDIFRHKRNRPNRLPRSPSCASASRNRPVGGGLPMVEQSGHHVDVTAPGVEEPHSAGSRRPTQTCLRCRTGISSATPRALLGAGCREGGPTAAVIAVDSRVRREYEVRERWGADTCNAASAVGCAEGWRS